MYEVLLQLVQQLHSLTFCIEAYAMHVLTISKAKIYAISIDTTHQLHYTPLHHFTI